MKIKRQHTRIKCSSYCILVGSNGDAYHALLGDISLGGAFVMTRSDTRLQVGDICQLMLSDDTAMFPIKRTGKVVRLESRCIGMSLLT
jgi:hypothetical protein